MVKSHSAQRAEELKLKFPAGKVWLLEVMEDK